jgi:hypothetical protein
MEREFLSILGYKVSVGMRLYTSCYYEVMALCLHNKDDAAAAAKKGDAGRSSERKQVQERYQTPHFYLIGNNENFDQDSQTEEEAKDDLDEDLEESDDYADIEEMQRVAAKAHTKFKRRNTIDVLSRTPPRTAGATRSISLGRKQYDE